MSIALLIWWGVCGFAAGWLGFSSITAGLIGAAVFATVSNWLLRGIERTPSLRAAFYRDPDDPESEGSLLIGLLWLFPPMALIVAGVVAFARWLIGR